MEIQELPIERLVEDWTLLPRGENSISGAHVARLADAIEAGKVLPPITVDQASWRIVSGVHRTRAYKRLRRQTVPGVLQPFRSEGEMYALAVAENRTHGLPLDTYDIRKAILRLFEYGYRLKQIAEIVVVPIARVEQLQKEVAVGRGEEAVPLKAGIMHLAGERVTRAQERAIESYGGMSATFYARQVLSALQGRLVRMTPAFVAVMDELVEAWKQARERLDKE